MFRDLKEYQEIAKIYAEKVSKPEDLEENRNQMAMKLRQEREANKPAPEPKSTKLPFKFLQKTYNCAESKKCLISASFNELLLTRFIFFCQKHKSSKYITSFSNVSHETLAHYVSHETFSLIKTNYKHKTKQWMDMM